jgi:2-keto-3-deoxy-6-phosphogluconate aldolase
MSEIGKALEPLPLVAILRGLEPADAMAVGATLHDAGFRIIEVTLNLAGVLRKHQDAGRKLRADLPDRRRHGAQA